MEKQYTCDCGVKTHAGPMKRHKQRCWTPRTLERLFELCQVHVGNEDECWPATKGLNDQGYARAITWNGVRTRATRLVVEVVLGRPLVPAEKVLHSCDNPPCMNPSHLRVGSQAENLKDMWAKGRGKLHTENLVWRWK